MFKLFIVLAAALPAFGADLSRRTLMSVSVEGYEPLAHIHSYLDVGLSQTDTEDGPVCEFLKPQPKTRAAKQVWAPFDFYTNILNDEQREEVRAEGELGEPAIFFPTDDNNRNRGKDPHTNTRMVVSKFRGSLDFLEAKRSKDAFSFLVKFTRGAIQFQSLYSARTWAAGDKCEAAVLDCTREVKDDDGTTRCEPDGWTRQTLKLLAQADVFGATKDKLNPFMSSDEKLQNDVASVEGVFQDLDSNALPVGKEYRETLATK